MPRSSADTFIKIAPAFAAISGTVCSVSSKRVANIMVPLLYSVSRPSMEPVNPDEKKAALKGCETREQLEAGQWKYELPYREGIQAPVVLHPSLGTVSEFLKKL